MYVCSHARDRISPGDELVAIDDRLLVDVGVSAAGVAVLLLSLVADKPTPCTDDAETADAHSVIIVLSFARHRPPLSVPATVTPAAQKSAPPTVPPKPKKKTIEATVPIQVEKHDSIETASSEKQAQTVNGRPQAASSAAAESNEATAVVPSPAPTLPATTGTDNNDRTKKKKQRAIPSDMVVSERDGCTAAKCILLY
jgi:hypothetical protein